MMKILRCVSCNRICMGDQWYLEGAVTAVELSDPLDAYCPNCRESADPAEVAKLASAAEEAAPDW